MLVSYYDEFETTATVAYIMQIVKVVVAEFLMSSLGPAQSSNVYFAGFERLSGTYSFDPYKSQDRRSLFLPNRHLHSKQSPL